MPRLTIPRRRRHHEHEHEERRRRRGFNAIWAFFWLILLIIVLGLLFGGYRKGTQIHPGSWVRTGMSAAVSTVSSRG